MVFLLERFHCTFHAVTVHKKCTGQYNYRMFGFCPLSMKNLTASNEPHEEA